MRVRQFALTILSFVLVTASFGGVAGASPLSLNGHWTTLDQDMTAPDFFLGDWSWTSSQAVKFDITDFLVVGDGYEVYDNGAPVASFLGKPDWTGIGGPCAGPFSAACGWTADPEAAFDNPLFNQGSLFFAPGSHDLRIQSLSIPTTGPSRSSRTAPSPSAPRSRRYPSRHRSCSSAAGSSDSRRACAPRGSAGAESSSQRSRARVTPDGSAPPGGPLLHFLSAPLTPLGGRNLFRNVSMCANEFSHRLCSSVSCTSSG